MTAAHAPVVDIQRFSLHDGPGIRTVVFFKGCSLDCAWCHNPEAIRAHPELAYYAERCIDGCDECLAACGRAALRPARDGRVDFARCDGCGACAEACPGEALVLVGRGMSVDELLDAVIRDRPFYAQSGGGVTLSGGEPVLQAAFLRAFLPRARAAGLHLALETAGSYPFARLAPLLPALDLILFDLKLADPAQHARWTGHGNRLVLATLRELLARDAPVAVRMPIVPGINTGPDEIAAMARLLDTLGLRTIELLPYNHLWEAKLPRLAHPRRPLAIAPPPPACADTLVAAFRRAGIAARVPRGGDESPQLSA